MTRILGVKTTHDGGIALVEDGVLKFSLEMEKLNNNPRHSAMESQDDLLNMLAQENIDPGSIDIYVVDGWKHGVIRQPLTWAVAPYHEGDFTTALCGEAWGNPLRGMDLAPGLMPEGKRAVSFPHITGHVVGSYVMAPWAKDREPTYVIAWDGGTGARLYLVDPNAPTKVTFVRHLHCLYGMLYGVMGYYHGPFRDSDVVTGAKDAVRDYPLFGERSWPGKLMSWIALGSVYMLLLERLWVEYAKIERTWLTQPVWLRNGYQQDAVKEHALMQAIDGFAQEHDLSDADVLATMHRFLERLLVERAVAAIPEGSKLIFTGGSALNIKWNSALRATNHFSGVFVPPCPNDSGSAIGMAATFMARQMDRWDLDWDVYAGPRLRLSETMPMGWTREPCSVEALVKRLTDHPDQCVTVLNGRAEIGPRALGHRSMLMSPVRKETQAYLNRIKRREDWRPVAPLILEDRVADYFTEGRDPYMLFDHATHEHRKAEVPAIVHLDDTARLQTVGPDMPFIHSVLSAFAAIPGNPPVLCNTSANQLGRGFFPSVDAALDWGKTPVWADGFLYTRVAGDYAS